MASFRACKDRRRIHRSGVALAHSACFSAPEAVTLAPARLPQQSSARGVGTRRLHSSPPFNMVTAGPSNMAQDTEFAVPQPPSAVRRSSSKSKGSTDQEAYHSKRAPRRVGPCRTSLEDTIENLVECVPSALPLICRLLALKPRTCALRLPLSSELLSTRAKADLAFHQRQSRALRHSTSQHSINSFGDSSEPLGPATPGIEAYKRPSSSGSSSSGGFIHDYYTSDPHEEGHIPRPELPYESQALQHRRPSTSSQASDTSRSRIPVPSNGLSKSWSASDGLATKSSRVNAETGTPRSTSHNSALADHLTMALPKRTSSRRQQSRPDQPGRTNQVKDTSNQQQPRPAASRQGHPAASQHTPTRASGKRVGDNYQSTSSRRNPALETKSTPLGSKRAPRAPAGGAGGAAQPRSRAVTGNAGTQRPAKEVLQKQSRSRSRSQSASGFDDAAAASQMDGPPLGDAAPVMYRSDHISKSKTSDSLADLARDRRREDEEHARLDQARTWDDVVIPTCAATLVFLLLERWILTRDCTELQSNCTNKSF